MINKKPEALIFADDRPDSTSDDLYQWSTDAEDLIRIQHARIVELEAQLAAAQQASEPYAVLVFEIGEEGPFDRKPVKPCSVQHLHAKRDPHYDYMELYTHPTKQGTNQ